MLFQIRVERALAAQPCKGAFCFLTQMDFFKLRFLNRRGASDFNFHKSGAWRAGSGGLGVMATRCDEFSLGELVGCKNFENSGEILIRELMRLATEEPANITTRETGHSGNVALIQMATLGLALDGDTEIAHFFALRVPGYATFWNWQH